MLFGSYFGDWDKPNNFLRGGIASPEGYGLAATWGSRPDWFFHTMGLGEPLGESALLTQNRSGTLYPTRINGFTHDLHTSLLGDPTLRLHYVAPPSGVRINRLSSSQTTKIINWQPSPDPDVLGYHVYHATTFDGPFVRANAALIPAGTHTFTDPNAQNQFVYMVRALKLETTPSGSYDNLGTGAFNTPLSSSNPTLSGGGFHGGGGGQQQAVLTFSEEIEPIVEGDVTVQNLTTGQVLDPATDYDLVFDAAARTATITFNTTSTYGQPGVLPDGIWRVTVSAGAVVGYADRAMAEDGVYDLLYLGGDADGNGVVNAADLAGLLNGYDLAAGMEAGLGLGAGDLDGDGDADDDDLSFLQQLIDDCL